MNPDRRAELLNRLTDWLDDLDNPEELPPEFPLDQISSHQLPDLVSMIAGFSSIAGELRTQGKHFNRMTKVIEDLNTRLSAPSFPEKTAHPETQVDVVKLLNNGREEGRNELLKEMIKLHDRLHRLLETSRRQLNQTGWMKKILGDNEIQQAVVEGLQIAMYSFDDILAKFEVTKFGEVDALFDPNCMKAVDAVSSVDIPPGKILGIIKYGYRKKGALLKYAEVMVSN